MQFHPLGFYRTKVAFTLMCMNLLELDRVGNPNDQFESNGDVKKFIILNTIQSNGKKTANRNFLKGMQITTKLLISTIFLSSKNIQTFSI